MRKLIRKIPLASSDVLMAKISLKVVPSSSRDQVVGWLGEALKIKVKAPPEKGKANAAVMELLATTLRIDADRINIVQGHSAPNKVASIRGLENSKMMEFLKRTVG